MKHAFLIEAHTNWGQLKTLISLLDDSRNSIYVHIDAKSRDFMPSEFEGITKKASLKFVPRSKVTWGGSNQIGCEMLLLKEALSSNSDYYHLLSGMDLPLHDMDYIDDFFAKNQGREFIHFTEIGNEMSSRTKQRISIWHPLQNMLGRRCKWTERILNRIELAAGINRLRKVSLVLGKGAQWFSITHDFAQYVVDNWPRYKKIFASSFCADEMFMQTMILNSPYREKINHPQPDDDYAAIMRLIEWDQGDLKAFTERDFAKLSTSPMLFARKFDEKIDKKIIEMIADRCA